MPNLGLLRIVEPRDSSVQRPRITDRVVRAWAERKDPFPALRILQLSCCVNLTPEILRYLSSFPALVYATVRALRSNWDSGSVFTTAPGLGWRVAGWPDDVQALMRRYFASCKGARDGHLERSEVAAAVVSAGKPARLSLLFDDVSTVQFQARPAVLPWDRSVSTSTGDACDAVHVSDLKNNKLRMLKANIHDNPAWWLYTAVGHVILRDGDLQSIDDPDSAVPTSNGWVLPPRPVLSLTMAAEGAAATSLAGGVPSGQAIDPLTKHVFVRESAFKDVASRETAWAPEKVAPPRERTEGRTRPANERAGDAPLRKRKKMRMGDLLSSMAGG